MDEKNRRTIDQIQGDISIYFKNLDIGLQIIPINDLLLEFKETLIFTTRKDMKEEVNARFDKAVADFRAEAKQMGEDALKRVEIVGMDKDGLKLFMKPTTDLLQEINKLQQMCSKDGSEIMKKNVEIQSLKDAICPDGSITNTEELIDFSKDLQDAYDKLSNIMNVMDENDKLKEQIKNYENSKAIKKLSQEIIKYKDYQIANREEQIEKVKQDLTFKFKSLVEECVEKGLATEMILVEGLNNLEKREGIGFYSPTVQEYEERLKTQREDLIEEIFNRMVKMEQASYQNPNLLQTYEVMWNGLKKELQFKTL